MGDDPRVLAPPAMAALVTTTGLAFAATKVRGPAGQAYRVAMGVAQWVPTAALGRRGGPVAPNWHPVSLVADRTDLFALLALVVPLALSGRRRAVRRAV